jgi:hypothetical protein
MHHGSELGLAELLLLTSEPIEVDVRFRSTDLEGEDEAGEDISNGLFHLADLCEQEAELTIAGGHADPVAQLLEDLEAALVLTVSLLVVPLPLGQDA